MTKQYMDFHQRPSIPNLVPVHHSFPISVIGSISFFFSNLNLRPVHHQCGVHVELLPIELTNPTRPGPFPNLVEFPTAVRGVPMEDIALKSLVPLHYHIRDIAVTHECFAETFNAMVQMRIVEQALAARVVVHGSVGE